MGLGLLRADAELRDWREVSGLVFGLGAARSGYSLVSDFG